MNIDVFFFILISTGVAVFLVGLIFNKYPPKKINWIYGYRTKNAMKSQAHWDFAQGFASKQMMKSAAVMILVSFAGLGFELSNTLETILALGIVIVQLIIPIYSTEKAIKKKFGQTVKN